MLHSLYTRLERMAAERPVLLAFWVFLGSMILVIPLSLPFYIGRTNEFWMNILAEAHGTVFDLLIIGWFLLWLNKIAERRLRNSRYREEIDDYLGWRSPEATHRIVGNIRRLNRGGVKDHLRLTEAFLSGANLAGAQLRNADLWGASLENASLRDADLSGANLAGAMLQGADLERARLTGADLRGCAMKESDLERADLDRADLRGSNLAGADLQYSSLKFANLNRTNLAGASLRGAQLQGANLSGARLQRANLRGAVLHETDLRLADLEGADLLGARLERAILPDEEADLLRLFGRVKTLFGTRLTSEAERVLHESLPELFQMAHSVERRVPSSVEEEGGDGPGTELPHATEAGALESRGMD